MTMAAVLPNMRNDVETFCEHYNKYLLHLATNNRWTFAFEIIAYILVQEEEEG